MAPIDSSNLSSDASKIDQTLKCPKGSILQNVTVVLGNARADKSTLVQWLDNTRNHYYDWPVFSDNQSTSEYISSPYAHKSVSSTFAKNVRLLFAIDYRTVRVGFDRRDFLEFLKHSTYFLKNVDKYRQSIALVVTKVDNSPNLDMNRKIVYATDEEIIKSIANFMKSVREDLKRNHRKANENYVKLIDAFLQRDGGQVYSRIVIFRRPDSLFSEIPLLQKGKVKLMEMVKKLKFSTNEKNDFGYSISESFKGRFEDSDNLSQAADTQKLANWFPQTDYQQPTVHMLSSVPFSKSDCRVIDEPSIEPLDWYQFLSRLNSKLGEYQFQQDPSRYNVANLEDWGEGQAKPQNIHIEKRNFSQFLAKLSQYKIRTAYAFNRDKGQIAQWQLDELNQVLSLTLKHEKTKINCTEDGKLVVTGDYVKLSDLKPRLVEMCPNRINSVDIFASHTLFLDSDLDGLGSELKLTLSAPKWKVVGERRIINLDGSAGAPPNPPKARNSDNAGINPEKGIAGLNGGNGGSFLGFAVQSVNREGLTITANGGAGGDGQEGGDGHDGVRGTDAPVPDQWCHFNAPYEVTWTRTEMHGFTQYNYTGYRINGTSGTEGGVGGDGGAGGTGGRQGLIKLNTFKGWNKQKIDTKPGLDGIGGRGGSGGYDGLHGNDLAAQCEFNSTWGFRTSKYRTSVPITYNHRYRAANGKDGANVTKVSQVVSQDLNSANVINEYKYYLRSRLNDVNDRYMALSAIVERLEKINNRKFDSLKNGNLNHSTDSLLSQIVKYTEERQPSESLNQKLKKKLNNFSTVDKLYNLNSSEPSLIYDVYGFLYYAQEVINILNKLRRNQHEHVIVQQKLANLIVNNINSAQFTDASDPQLLSVAKQLESRIRSNFVLQQYDSVVAALKQLVFPYARFYVKDEFNHNSTDAEYLVNSAVVSLGEMRLRVLDNRSCINKVDGNSMTTIFKSDDTCKTSHPFFVWSNGKHREAITKLLSGESILLNADIRLSESAYYWQDAIKFTKIEFNLKALKNNSTTQAEIDAKLENFIVTATHMGNSHYRHNDKYYLIVHQPVHFEHSFAKRPDELPIYYNYGYDKIVNGSVTHSPYAMWLIQLAKMNETVTFDQLAAYRGDVDLELVGQGIYTDSVQSRSDYLHVDRYYSEYETRALLDSNVTETKQLNSANVMKVTNPIDEVRVLEQMSNSTGPLSYIYRLGEPVTNLFDNSNSTVNTHHIAHPRFDYTRHNNNNNSNLTQSSNSVDVHGNLLMGQLLVSLFAGKNSTITSGESYQSPEQTRNLEVDTLAQRVVPVLYSSTRFRSSQLHSSNNQWHRDWNDTSREHN